MSDLAKLMDYFLGAPACLCASHSVAGRFSRFSFQAYLQKKMPVRCGGSFQSPPRCYGIFYFAAQGFSLQSRAQNSVVNLEFKIMKYYIIVLSKWILTKA